MRLVVAFLVGVEFAVGLGVGGMTQPARVIGFLDVFGHWDPTLAFVMAGAVLMSFGLFPVILRRRAPVLAQRFFLPEKKDIDVKLVLGAAVFGVGWGLGGYCPGPAVVSVVTGAPSVLVFVAAMCVGTSIGRRCK